MIDRWRQKQQRQRRLNGLSHDGIGAEGSNNNNNNSRNGVRLRPSSAARNKSTHANAMGKLSRSFVCVAVLWKQIGFEANTVGAFSLFRPEFALPPSTRELSPTARFLFSLGNGDNGEGDETNSNKSSIQQDEGILTTTTVERTTTDWDAEKEGEDFSAWMEGLARGTPLGKMTSAAAALRSDGNDTEPVEPSTSTAGSSPPITVVSSVDLRESKSNADSSAPAINNNKSKSNNDNNNNNNNNIQNQGRRKVNPLSNLIQFEAMLELAKIAGTKDANEKGSGNGGDGSPATDVFAVVDRLVKTFQKQEEDEQKQRKELLQLARLEETTVSRDKLVDENNDNDNIDNEGSNAVTSSAINVEEVSTATTVKDLMELDRYVSGLPIPKVSNIWDTFSKVGSVATTVEDASKDDAENDDSVSTLQPSTGSASSSPLFRGNESKDSELTSSSTNLAQAAESILKDTTNKMEYLVAEASSAILEPSGDGSSTTNNTSALQDLVGRASSVFNNNTAAPSRTTATTTTTTIVESISNDIVAAAQKIAKESGVDINVQFAADRAREATEFAVGVATTANMVLDAGYAYGSRSGAAGMSGRDDDFNYLAASAATQTAGSVFSTPGDGSVLEGASVKAPPHQPPLFGEFDSAQRIEPYEYENVVFQGAEVGVLAGAIYEDAADRCHKLGHSLVANGTTANVAWMVTDSVMERERYASAFRHHDDAIPQSEDDSKETSKGPVMIRTITLRGFDASDESVDREALLNEICLATPEPMDDATADRVVFHKGLLNIARQIYADTKKYIDWTSPNHKIILNGHSVGGSLSVLMLLLITSERGSNYARDRILRVYSHGSPPVAMLSNNTIVQRNADENLSGAQRCSILEAFDLPSSIVYGFIQPYDPVVRLFSNHDVLYPLVDDLGRDGITLYSTGPIRSLRPITRAIFQAWNGWPQFRDNWKGTCDMQYQSVGIQHMLLPEPLRYLNDRFISVNVGVPPVDAIVRIAPEDLLPALDLTFPLDTFQVSLVPQAVRSFLHHFYPAYDSAISDYATKVKFEEKIAVAKKSGAFKPFQTTHS